MTNAMPGKQFSGELINSLINLVEQHQQDYCTKCKRPIKDGELVQVSWNNEPTCHIDCNAIIESDMEMERRLRG